MKARDIQRFFEELDRRIAFPIRVILTGGAAAVLYGVRRVTLDIDFEVHLKVKSKSDKDAWGLLQQHLTEVSKLTGISPQYAEDIDRWSAIAIPDKKSRAHGRIGKIEIRIFDPAVWSIGKLTRSLQTDIEDLLTVLKQSKVNPKATLRYWGRALGSSPPSSSQDQFRRSVENFLEAHAQSIWGKKTNVEKLKALFIEAAREARKKKSG